MLYNEKVIPMVFQLAAKFTGGKDAEKSYEENKELINSLLAAYAEKEKSNSQGSFFYDWSDRVAESFNNDLTTIQRIILKTILGNGNKATLKEVVKSLIDNKFKEATTYTIAGTLAGLTRKCQKYDIPYIYDFKKTDDGSGYYFVTEAALPFIKKYL